MFTGQAFVASSKAVSVLCRERNPDWQPSSNFFLVTLLPLYPVTLEYPVTLLPCYPVILLPCYLVTLLHCYLVTLLSCYFVTLLPC